MANRLIIEGNTVYEIDEECERAAGKTGLDRGCLCYGNRQKVKTNERLKKAEQRMRKD